MADPAQHAPGQAQPGTRLSEVVSEAEDLAAALYDATAEEAEKFGLAPYEISNYAVPGGESRHNLAYWRYGDYAGIGPGAHGRLTFNGNLTATRRHRAPEPWADMVETQGHGSTAETEVPARDRAREALLMGLRLAEGIAAKTFAARTGVQLQDAIDPATLEAAVEENYLIQTPTHLIATSEGRKRLDALLPALAR